MTHGEIRKQCRWAPRLEVSEELDPYQERLALLSYNAHGCEWSAQN
jgi:hypothetical protein